jgi:ADP-heptose:LPS heptosyltransferase
MGERGVQRDLGCRLRARAAFAGHDAANVLLRATRDALFLKRRPPQDPKRILVHHVGNIGDIVAVVPSLLALRERYPRAHVTLATSAGRRDLPGAQELLRGATYIDEILEYPIEPLRTLLGAFGMVEKFRAVRADLLVMLPPSLIQYRRLWRNLAFARLLGAEYVVGIEAPLLRMCMLDQAASRPTQVPEAERLLALLAPLEVNARPVHFELPAPTEVEGAAVNALVVRHRPFVAICPGGKQVGHLWALTRFAEIAKRIRASGLQIIAVGSKAEATACKELVERAGGGVVAAGRFTVQGTAALLRAAEMLVTNDTGPMHLAAAMGTRVVAIFGSRDFAGRWYPYGQGHEVFRARVVCDECFMAPTRTDHCVREITVDDVWQGCLRVLDRVQLATATEAP